MKTNKRNIFRILCAVLSVSIMLFCTLMLVGCGDSSSSAEPTESASQSQFEPESESKVEITVSLDKKTLTLAEWESATLVAAVSGTDEAVLWESSDESVATVDGNGNVTALAVGETTITAKVGDVNDSCRVVVEKSSAEPVLAIAELDDERKLILRDSGSFMLHASVLWNGEAIDGATISWTSDNEEIAIVTGNGYEVSVSGLKEGETTIRVVSTVRGKTAVCVFDVKVNPESAIIKTDSEAFLPSEGGYKVTINAVEEAAGDNTNVTELDFYASYKGQKIENPTIVWTTENDDIIEMDAATGKITAKQSGSALISGVWHYDVTDKDYSVKVNVEVVKVNVEIEDVAEVVVNRAEAFTLNISDETVQSYDVDGKNFTDGFTALGNVAKFDGANFDVADQTKRVSVKIITNKRVYAVNVDSYYAIADLNEWKSVWNATASAKIFTKASVIKIENDLNVSSYAPSPNISYANKTSFSGIFDGQGHTIVGATAGWESLFNSVSESGVIKNVAFIGITLKQETTMFYNKFDGMIENCYFEAGIDRNSINATPAFTCTLGRTAVIRNVVMNIRGRGNNEKNAAQKAIFRYFGTGEGQPTISGLYASVDVSDGNASYETTVNDNMKVYSSMAGMRADVTALPEKFSSDIWEMYDGMLLLKSSVSVIADYISKNELTVTEIASVNKEVESTLSANRACEWSIEGLDSSMYTLENGVLTLSSAAPVGETFTIVATYTETRFGHVYTVKTENIVIKNKPAEVKNLDVKPIVGLNRTTETYSFAMDGEAEVLGVTINGAATDSYTVSGNVVTINADAFATLGEVEIVIETEAILYKASAEVFDYALGSLAELKTFWNVNNLKGTINSTVVLTADIDATGYENGGNIGSFDFAGVIDGRGHTINNIRAGWSGLFYNLTSSGVVKNISFTGIKLLVAPMIFGYKLEGTVENCYFEGSPVRTGTKPTPAFCTSLGRTAVIKNVVVNVHDSYDIQIGAKSVFNYYIAGSGLPTIEGLYAVVDYSNGTASGEATANEKIHLYATAAAMRADVTALPEGFSSDIWQMYDGMLSFKSSENVIKAYIDGVTFEVGALASVNKETETALSADKPCEWSVEGLDSSMYTLENGVLILSSAAPVGETFTIVATYAETRFGHKYTQKIENIVIKNKPLAEKNLDEVVAGKNKAEDTVVEITAGEEFVSLYVDETFSESVVTISGGTATIPFEVMSALGAGDHVLKIETNGTLYVLPIVVADIAIDTAEEFGEWYKNGYTANLAATIVLTSDITLDSSVTYTGYTNTGSHKFTGTFDGRGHTIANFGSGGGFIPVMFGTLKNVALVNARTTGGIGFIGHQIDGKISNVYYQGTASANGDYGAYYTWDGGHSSAENVVISLNRGVGATVDPVSSKAAFAKITGMYVINTCSSGTTKSSGVRLFTNTTDFATTVNTLPEGFDADLWTINDVVGLTFKSAEAFYSGLGKFLSGNEAVLTHASGKTSMAQTLTLTEEKVMGIDVYSKVYESGTDTNQMVGISPNDMTKYSQYAFAVKTDKAQAFFGAAGLKLPANTWSFIVVKWSDADSKFHLYHSYDSVFGFKEQFPGYYSWFTNFNSLTRFKAGTADGFTAYFTDVYVVAK